VKKLKATFSWEIKASIMKTLFKSLLILLMTFPSCKKEDFREPISAGIYDTGFIYHEFSAPLKVKLTLDALTDNYKGTDSIDINLDGAYDLIISQRIHLPPPTGIPSWEQFPYYRLSLKNGLEVATKFESYPVGHGQYDDVNWVDSLNFETRIDNISEWSDTNMTYTMWAIPPISAGVTYGPWYSLTNVVKYIGIRMKIGSHYKYGWIKVNEISHEDMSFVSYALER
jgi:hypothetical protein